MKKLFFLILFVLTFVASANAQFNWLYNYERPQNGGSEFYVRTDGGAVADTLHNVNGTANVTLEEYTTRKYMALRPRVTRTSGDTDSVNVDILIQFAPRKNGEEPTDGDYVTFSALTTTLSATGQTDIVFDTPYPSHSRWRTVLDGQAGNAADVQISLIFSARDQ